MKKGFTLVELSIVLVIIGLLIGGILVGQTLIESAKLQSQIRQVQQFDIAFYGFKSKFKQLPGDSNLVADPGDNDRIIENDKTLGAPAFFNYQLAEEKANFWRHLTGAGLMNGNFTNTPVPAGGPYIYTPDSNAPRAAIDKNAVVTLFHTGNQASSPARMFWYITTSTFTGVFTGPQAMAIDKKLDDGLGYGFSGNRKTVYSPGSSPSCAGSGGPTSGPYVVNDPDLRCRLAIEIGVATDQ